MNTRSAMAGGMSRSCSSRLSRKSRAVEVGGLEAGARNHLCQQRQRRRRRPLERREPDERRIGADLGLELRAEPAERLVQRQRVEPAAAFIEEVSGERREPGRSAGSSAAPARMTTSTETRGTSRCSAVQASRPFDSFRCRISGSEAARGREEAGAID